jgi:hypothetical protein
MRKAMGGSTRRRRLDQYRHDRRRADYYADEYSSGTSLSDENNVWGAGWDDFSSADFYEDGHFDPDERQQHRHKMEATFEDVTASWNQAGKHVQIGSHDHAGFHPHIGGRTAVRRLHYDGHHCVAMDTRVMNNGVHTISLRAGNYNKQPGHVRVGVGPGNFFDRPASISAEQQYAGLPYGSCDGLVDDTGDLPVYLAAANAHGTMWSGSDGKVWADGNGTHWGDGDNCYTYQDIISLKLDLNVGVLEAYKNGTSLGIIREDMRGPLCWACELWYESDCAIIVKDIV